MIIILFLLMSLAIAALIIFMLYRTEQFDTVKPTINAYVISLNDDVYEKAVNNLSIYFPKDALKKFDAIKGSSLKGLNTNLMTIGAYRSILHDVNRRAHADLGSINAVGCALSHSTLWKMIKPGEGMFIFESDAILTENPIPYVEEFLQMQNPHMLLFGPIGKSRSSDKMRQFKRVDYQFFGMHGYYITYEGAQILLKYMFPIEQQVDSYISDLLLLDLVQDKDPEIHFGLNVYILDPGICYQYNKEGTSIQTKKVV